MEEIEKRLDAIERKLDLLLMYLGEEDEEEEVDGDEFGASRDTSQTL